MTKWLAWWMRGRQWMLFVLTLARLLTFSYNILTDNWFCDTHGIDSFWPLMNGICFMCFSLDVFPCSSSQGRKSCNTLLSCPMKSKGIAPGLHVPAPTKLRKCCDPKSDCSRYYKFADVKVWSSLDSPALSKTGSFEKIIQISEPKCRHTSFESLGHGLGFYLCLILPSLLEYFKTYGWSYSASC